MLITYWFISLPKRLLLCGMASLWHLLQDEVIDGEVLGKSLLAKPVR